MSPNELNEQLKQTVSQLSEPESLHGLFREVSEGDPLPSAPALAEIIDLCRAILFPGFYGKSLLSRETLPYHIGVSLDRLSHLLTQQVLAGLCFQRTEPVETCKLTEKAQTITGEFIAWLPELRQILATDVEAAYNGDPAADSYGEIISCYPVIKALTCYRIAHELLLLGVPLIPRIITEMAHSETGIDIHPRSVITLPSTTEPALSSEPPASSATMSNCIRVLHLVRRASRSTTTAIPSKASPVTRFSRIMSSSTVMRRFSAASPWPKAP